MLISRERGRLFKKYNCLGDLKFKTLLEGEPHSNTQ